MLAIVNPAAGGGRCGRGVDRLLARLAPSVDLKKAETKGPGDATEMAREAYRAGTRTFLAVGGDGTAFEVVNGLMPAEDRVALGFLPLGTGNSFLRDFSDRGVDHAIEKIAAGARRPCDILRLHHRDGVTYSINYVSLGFPATVGATTNRWFKPFGRLGYVLGVLTHLVRLPHPTFAVRVDDDAAMRREPCLFLTFSNSKFTGGTMMIAPQADTADGLIEHVRMGRIGRLKLLRSFGKLFDGTYVELPQASRRPATRVVFELEGPSDVMIDGEVVRLHCEALDILPGALDVIA
ncbi:MAG: diacylglycerol/lipid kinase family protein [Planctomycetota bacterium]|jgi:YegS/Rv2252/BmrU family lipid kinase